MKKQISYFALISTLLLSTNVMAAPVIKGEPIIITPDHLLNWPSDFKQSTPYLTEPTANRLNDLHGQISGCDMVLSTAGNYHMALREMWPIYLKNNNELNIKTWGYTTSPPISPDQIISKTVQFGNINLNCEPQVAVGPKKIINKLKKVGAILGKPIKILKNQGNVILVKKGNPKNIKSVWDLGRSDVTFVSPNPNMESGSFTNFSKTIYNIAKHDDNPPKNMNAQKLFDSIFNTDQSKCKVSLNTCKWVSGKRIMHREQPWAINSGKADAGVIFYHLALHFTKTFPDKFEIVSLGGTAAQPNPVKGNKVGVLQAVRLKGDWNKKQLAATEGLMREFASNEFTDILEKHGIKRP